MLSNGRWALQSSANIPKLLTAVQRGKQTQPSTQSVITHSKRKPGDRAHNERASDRGQRTLCWLHVSHTGKEPQDQLKRRTFRKTRERAETSCCQKGRLCWREIKVGDKSKR